MTASVVGLILAAGQSRRMGAKNKLLHDWRGKPLLRHVLDRAKASDLSSIVIVTGHEAEIVEELVGDDATCIHNSAYAEGMASSLAGGIDSVSQMKPIPDGILVLLGDMPLIKAADIDFIISKFEAASSDKVVVATSDGKNGHPVLFPRRLFAAFSDISGDRGAKDIITTEGDNVVKVEIGSAALRDFDTPEAFSN